MKMKLRGLDLRGVIDMNTDEVMESLKDKFTSGNSIAVSQSTITREEYEAILAYQQATKESEAEIERLTSEVDRVMKIGLELELRVVELESEDTIREALKEADHG